MFDINHLEGEFREGKLADDGVYITPVGRLSYESLFARSAYQGPNKRSDDKATFNCCIIFNVGQPTLPGVVDVNPMLAHFKHVAEQFYASKNMPMPYEAQTSLEFFGLWDGRRRVGKDGYGEGMWYISAKNYSAKLTQIPVVDSARNPVPQTGIKSGDFVRLRVDPYVSANYPNKGINIGLKSVQLLMPWEAFGSEQNDTGDEWGTVPVPGQAPTPVPGGGW